jgi:glycosyltransferase involved in cell wall biosynthesis
VEQTGGGVLVEPNDPHALADALERLLRDPAERARFGQAGRAAVWERFTARRMAEETLGVLKAFAARA